LSHSRGGVGHFRLLGRSGTLAATTVSDAARPTRVRVLDIIDCVLGNCEIGESCFDVHNIHNIHIHSIMPYHGCAPEALMACVPAYCPVEQYPGIASGLLALQHGRLVPQPEVRLSEEISCNHKGLY
jgi:hypothetical protein